MVLTISILLMDPSFTEWAAHGSIPAVAPSERLEKHELYWHTTTHNDTNSVMCTIYTEPALEVIVPRKVFFFGSSAQQQTADGQLQLFSCCLIDVLAS